jgi:hypothetical protein
MKVAYDNGRTLIFEYVLAVAPTLDFGPFANRYSPPLLSSRNLHPTSRLYKQTHTQGNLPSIVKQLLLVVQFVGACILMVE